MASLRLYVGSLPYVAQKLEVEQLFVDNDLPIKKVDISIDPFTGRNPGYSFVDFHTIEDAERALETCRASESVDDQSKSITIRNGAETLLVLVSQRKSMKELDTFARCRASTSTAMPTFSIVGPALMKHRHVG
ncbi:hypothetical protein D0865_15045 [Hortaea werneckii]|uniref:RRM domain-containing protein n=1 Tax=Hortaea werneckii TaxID=91943 RepID=A0A3M7AUN6_HORWE|nr:hypothetical protein D0865_15045 [Hortaea werneckii]